MFLFRTTHDLFHQNALSPDVEGTDYSACPHEEGELAIVVAIGKGVEGGVAEEFDARMGADVPQAEGLVFAGGEEGVGLEGGD